MRAAFLGQICYNQPWRVLSPVVSKSWAKDGNGSAMHDDGSDRFTPEHPPDAREAGGRLVVYEYCISLLVITLRRTSRAYRLRPGESGRWQGLPYTLVSLLLGWWGIPWGILYTPVVVLTNL